MRIGIYTHYIDKYPRSAPSLYQAELIKKLIEKTNLEIILIHHRKTTNPLYKLADEAVIPRTPYLREKAINKLDLDLIHFNAIPWSWWPSITKLETPSIATVHGTIHWDAPNLDDYTPIPLRPIKRTLEKQVAKHITHFIAISNHVRQVLRNKLAVNESKISVIYLPIDLETFKPQNKYSIQRIKQKYGIKSRYILHVSAFSKRKNPHGLFKSFSLVKKKIKEIKLVIVGNGWNNRYVQNLINALNLKNNILILGWLPKKDLATLYTGAEALLFPSIHENLGFPVIEAMASGCPVVASNAYAIPEVTRDAALLCPPNNYYCFAEALLNLLNDHNLRENMIKKGLQRAKYFNWENHISNILNIYKNTLRK